MKHYLDEILKNKILFWVVISFILIVITIIIDFFFFEFDLEGFVTEWHGFLLDIVVFGVILSIYEYYSERNKDIKYLKKELRKNLTLDTKESVLQKIDDIKSLNKYSTPLPKLFGIYLDKAKDDESIDFSKSDMRYVQANFASFLNCNFTNVVAQWGWMKNSNFSVCDFNKANFSAVHFDEAIFNDCQMKNTIFTAAYFIDAHVDDSDLTYAIFRRARMEGVSMNKTNVTNADFDGANLEGADLRGVIGLTKEQLVNCKTDINTKLPDYLN